MTIRSILDKRFKYVAAKDSTVERLRERFQQIREEIEANRKEAEAKVSTIKPKLKARTA